MYCSWQNQLTCLFWARGGGTAERKSHSDKINEKLPRLLDTWSSVEKIKSWCLRVFWYKSMTYLPGCFDVLIFFQRQASDQWLTIIVTRGHSLHSHQPPRCGQVLSPTSLNYLQWSNTPLYTTDTCWWEGRLAAARHDARRTKEFVDFLRTPLSSSLSSLFVPFL